MPLRMKYMNGGGAKRNKLSMMQERRYPQREVLLTGGYIYAAGHRFTTSPINFAWDGEGGYTITIKTGGNPWFHNYQKEVELRKFVQNLYSPGGELYPTVRKTIFTAIMKIYCCLELD